MITQGMEGDAYLMQPAWGSGNDVFVIGDFIWRAMALTTEAI